MKLRLNPSVREINRYLTPVLDELLAKHKKVSNPDFEKEFKEVTGIGYRQARNYKHHPKPYSRVNDNALVIPFILLRRRGDNKRKVKLIFISIALLGITVLFGYKFYKTITAPTVNIITSNNQDKVNVDIGEVTRKKLSLKINLNNQDVNFNLGQKQTGILNNERYKCFKAGEVSHCQYSQSATNSILTIKYSVS